MQLQQHPQQQMQRPQQLKQQQQNRMRWSRPMSRLQPLLVAKGAEPWQVLSAARRAEPWQLLLGAKGAEPWHRGRDLLPPRQRQALLARSSSSSWILHLV
jgi:hypothetical protein